MNGRKVRLQGVKVKDDKILLTIVGENNESE